MWQIPCKMTNSSSKPLQTLGKWYQPRNPKKIPNLFKKKILKLFHTLSKFCSPRIGWRKLGMYIYIFLDCRGQHPKKLRYFLSVFPPKNPTSQESGSPSSRPLRVAESSAARAARAARRRKRSGGGCGRWVRRGGLVVWRNNNPLNRVFFFGFTDFTDKLRPYSFFFEGDGID